MKSLSIAILLALPLFLTAQDSCIGCSTAKDQWIWDACFSQTTQNAWGLTGINPDPNRSLKPGQRIIFFEPGQEELSLLFTRPADELYNCPWLLVGNTYDSLLYARSVSKVVLQGESQLVDVATKPKTNRFNSWGFVIGFCLMGLLALVLIAAILYGVYKIFQFIRVFFANRKKTNNENLAQLRGQQIAEGEDPAFVGPAIARDGIDYVTAGANLALNYKDNAFFLGPWYKCMVEFHSPVSFRYADGVNSSPVNCPNPIECYIGKFKDLEDNEVWLPSVRRCGNGIYIKHGDSLPVKGVDFSITKVLEGEGWQEQLFNYATACRDLGVKLNMPEELSLKDTIGAAN